MGKVIFLEESAIVVMLKNMDTGLFEKELYQFCLDELSPYIYNIFAFEEGEKLKLAVRLTCIEELEDWEYEACFDYYDSETILPFITSFKEEEGFLNPVWTVTLDCMEDEAATEQNIKNLLKAHKMELESVLEAIKDKKDEYLDYEEKE